MKVFKIILYLTLLFLCIEKNSFGAETYTYSKRLKIYYSQWVNYRIKDESYTNISMMNQQKGSTEPDRTDFAFFCPGNSVLIGIASKYDERPFDRRFRFTCAFYDNEKGEQAKKDKCNAFEKTYDNKGTDEFTIAAGENQFIQGIASAIHPDKDQDDRLYKGLICNLNNWSGTQITLSKTSCKDSVSAGGNQSDFQFTCPVNQAITKIKSKYTKSQQDRQFTFTCCGP